MLVANARMYAIAPGAREAWRALFAWVAERADVPLTYVDHAAPAPLEELWARRDLGAAFMCGFPFARATPQPILVAAPMPSPARYGGRAVYCSDLIVRADSPAERWADLSGKRMGWTVEHSQSGYYAVRHHLLEYPQQGFTWVGPLVTPRRVIDAVLNREIDAGPLDSYVHELLKRHEPETAARLRVVDSTAMTPIPVLVAARDADAAAVARLREVLLAAGREAEGLLEPLMLKGFAAADPGDYALLLTRAMEANAKFAALKVAM
jgi:ABC-type phosphate/phosphonate transport system substrate-binding protein